MKRVIIWGILFCVCFSLIGCNTNQSSEQGKTESNQAGYTFTDALNRTVTVKDPKRVGSVMGSFAEVWQLAGGKLTAVTQDAVSERGLKLEANVIDLGSMKSPSTEACIAADLDFLLLSADIDGHVALRKVLEQAKIPFAYFSVETFDDYLKMLDICTNITANRKRYQENGVAIQSRVQAAIDKSKEKESPTVLLIRAFSTGAKAKGSDSMAGAMLKDLGCVNIADSNDSLLEELSLEQIIKEDPDYIFVTTMGSSDKAALDALEKSILSNPAWKGLTAVKENRYHVLPKDLFHYKPNARWGESYEMLSNILYGAK